MTRPLPHPPFIMFERLSENSSISQAVKEENDANGVLFNQGLRHTQHTLSGILFQ